MARGGTQERLELLGGPGVLLDLRDRPQSWCVGDDRGVSRDEPAAHGVGERTPDDEMNLVDGLRRERRSTVGWIEEPVVERFEVVGSEASQSDPADGGHDVVLDLAPVPVVGGGREHEPLGRQPPAGEVGPKAQRPDLVVDALELAGQPGCEPLGVGPLGSGGVPAASFLARHGVDALVDHGVPAVALSGHVSLHGDPPVRRPRRSRPVEGSVEGLHRRCWRPLSPALQDVQRIATR